MPVPAQTPVDSMSVKSQQVPLVLLLFVGGAVGRGAKRRVGGDDVQYVVRQPGHDSAEEHLVFQLAHHAVFAQIEGETGRVGDDEAVGARATNFDRV